jgi:hypothetical protein
MPDQRQHHQSPGREELPVIARQLALLASALAGCTTYHGVPRFDPAHKLDTTRDGVVSVDRDRFTKNMTATLTDMRVPRGDRGDAFEIAFVANRDAGILMIDSLSDDWTYLRCHRIDLLADDAPVPLAGETNHEGTILPNAQVEEHVSVAMTATAMDQIAHASKLEARICQDELSFAPAQVAAFHGVMALAKTIDP